MITASFDISNMFFRSMYIVGGYGNNGYTYDKQFELDQLMRKIATDIAFTIRQLNPTRVIFTLDSGSWRKQIEIAENEGYKGNREKSEHINWDNIYATMEEFNSIMGGHGFIVSKVNNAEADDLMALWMDKITFQKHEHIIFVSGDEDIRQLVKSSYDGPDKWAFSTVFNPFTYRRGINKKLYVSEHFEKWLNTDDGINDIFNTTGDPDKETFRKILSNSIDLEVIDPEDIGLRKIFCGDDGDNIPAIYTWMAKTAKGDPIERRITKSKYEKIKEKFNLTDYVDLSDHIDEIYKELATIAKHEPTIDMASRITRQVKLVILSHLLFPTEIVDTFNSDVDEKLKTEQPKLIGATMQSLLEGTRYISDEGYKNAAESDIFKEMDKISKQLF